MILVTTFFCYTFTGGVVVTQEFFYFCRISFQFIPGLNERAYCGVCFEFIVLVETQNLILINGVQHGFSQVAALGNFTIGRVEQQIGDSVTWQTLQFPFAVIFDDVILGFRYTVV